VNDEQPVKKSDSTAAGSGPIVEIVRAEPSDSAELTSLLNYYNLSTAGLDAHLATALVARADQHVVGSVALEVYDTAALLRSVAVAPHLRGRRLGERLMLAAFDLAREHGVEYVYLLAESASDFFLRFGFAPISREEVPLPLYQAVKPQLDRAGRAQVMGKRILPLE
jgi:amino-acid N-acetyltransferase